MTNYLNLYIEGENPLSNGFKGMAAPLTGEGFFLGAADGYTSTSDCTNACYTCMTESIAAGSKDTLYLDVWGREAGLWSVSGFKEDINPKGIRRCWMGFHVV